MINEIKKYSEAAKRQPINLLDTLDLLDTLNFHVFALCIVIMSHLPDSVVKEQPFCIKNQIVSNYKCETCLIANWWINEKFLYFRSDLFRLLYCAGAMALHPWCLNWAVTQYTYLFNIQDIPSDYATTGSSCISSSDVLPWHNGICRDISVSSRKKELIRQSVEG